MAINERRWVIPAFWDKEYLVELEKEGLIPSIYEVYGSLSSSPMGSMRTRASLPEATTKDIGDFVQKLHTKGIKFSYALNAMTFRNSEYTAGGRKEIFKFLDWLKEIRADSVIIANPFLAKLIKEHYTFEVSVSSVACVDSVQKAADWQEMKVASIKLPLVANRNFLLLRSIIKNTTAEVEVMVNQLCLYQCPFERYHTVTTYTDSQAAKRWGKAPAFLDWCRLNCNLIRWGNPAELIKSPFIRPEDVPLYRRCGVKFFKIVGRNKRMRNRIVTVIKAYQTGKWPGNLLDIVGINENPPPFEMTQYYPASDFEKYFTEPLYYVDNPKLAGFINYFIENGQKCSYLCGTCQYCDQTANRVVRLPSEERLKKFLDALNELDAATKTKESRLFA
ncbi:MAG: U32 family peptidase [Chloroflexota bacterium]